MNTLASKPPVVLVDGSSYLFRAYHALPPLTNSEGMPTGAVKGVTNMLRSLQKEYPDSVVVVVFDAKGKNFRHEMYPEYKANRPPMPEDLAVQIAPLHDLVEAMGLPMLVIEGAEADDVIGTLSHQAEGLNQPTVISTGDKDMAQLVNPHVTLINTMTSTSMDEAGVVEKFGVRPEQITDYLALIGDTVDNIPGVPKCGPKTASKWLDAYGSLENLMQKADEIKGKIGENLRESLSFLPLSKDLATIRCDIELPQPLGEIRHREPDQEKLTALLTQLEFRGWLKELQSSPSAEESDQEAPPASDIRREDYELVTNTSQLQKVVETAASARVLAFDTETTGLNYRQAELVGISLAVDSGHAWYIPVAHDPMIAAEQLDRETVLKAVGPLLENPDTRKVAQNLKYDAHILAKYGIEPQNCDDTMLLSYVLNPTAHRHDMDTLSETYLNHTPVAFTDIAGKKGPKQLTFDQVPLAQACEYAAEDADVTWRLHAILSDRLSQEKGIRNLYETIERPLVSVLTRMENAGARVDENILRIQSQELAERMGALQEQAFELAGESFNLGSTKQLQAIFYDKLGFEVLKKTPKGQPSTAEPVLVELAEKYELPKVLLEYRSLSKLKSTYTDRLPEMIDPDSGRVHTSYHQAVTATGRLSSSDPNLQNIPIKTEEGRRIREAFIAEPGHRLVSADYSQVELRIMAHLSNDDTLCQAFADGRDVHRATAAEVFGESLDSVTDDQRRKAKAINFGLIYGMSAFGLSRQLRIERDEAQHYIDRYFERYPGVREYMDRVRKDAHETGYVETLFGRRLYLPDINARNRNLQQAAERLAINAPMQGTAADIIKRAMLTVDEWLKRAHPEVRMIMQVHDELILEVPEDRVEEVRQALTDKMSGAAELRIPLLVEAGVGQNWGEAH